MEMLCSRVVLSFLLLLTNFPITISHFSKVLEGNPLKIAQKHAVLLPASDGNPREAVTLPCGNYTLLEGEYQITSPDFPSQYPTHQRCDYDIRGRFDQIFTFHCDVFSLEQHPSCAWDWFLVDIDGTSGTKYCGTAAPPGLSTAHIQLQFVSDYSVVSTGYRCYISVPPPRPLSCGDSVLTEGLYRIQSPGFPNSYANNTDCVWRFTSPREAHHLFKFSCSSFSLEGHPKCAYDWLAVNGYDNLFCGDVEVAGTSANSLRLHFYSDHSVGGAGFNCELKVTVNTCCGHLNSPAKKSGRIAGGVAVPSVLLYPWLAAIVLTGSNRSFCGAAVISDRYLASAAHCVHDRQPVDIQALLHVHDTSGEKIRRNISEIFLFPGYAGVEHGGDVALLRLHTPLNFADMPEVSPVCMPDDSVDPIGKNATVVGWGATFLGGPPVSLPRQTIMTVISEEECKHKLGSVDRSMLCTFTPGQSACSGDSGGPLIVETNGRMTLLGVVSYGRGCGSSTNPGVYGRITKVNRWIMKTTFGSKYCYEE